VIKKKKKICVIASSRATFGYKKNILKELQKDKLIDLKVIVTGMHLSKEYGYSVQDIIQEKIKIYKKINTNIRVDNEMNLIKSLSKESAALSKIFYNIKPDIVLVTGDRAEMFVAAYTAVYMNIIVAHIQAGDLSGHVDGTVRHAITKLSHLHFASCKDSHNRILKFGEQRFRIFNTGAPQIDDFYKKRKVNKLKFEKSLKVKLKDQFILIIQHPVLNEIKDTYNQIENTINACSKFKNIQKIIIYPNIDTGNSKIISKIKSIKNKDDFLVFKNLQRDYFIFLLSKAKVLVGNSSCGILEASSFKLPVINIGSRQRGRLQSKNILNCDYSEKKIYNLLNKVFCNKKFNNRLKKCTNPYGDGNSSQKIVNILKKIKINNKLLDKINTY